MKTQLQTNATKYFGAALEGYKYELQIDVELDKQFINESAIALFNGGLGTQFDIHDKIVVNEQYNEGIIKQIAKYLAPIFVVANVMMKEIKLRNNGKTTCQNLSPVLSACLAQINVETTDNI